MDSVLLTIAQIGATVISIVAGLLGAFVVQLIGTRSSAEERIAEIGKNILDDLLSSNHEYILLDYHTVELLQEYARAYSDESEIEYTLRAFLDVKGLSENSTGVSTRVDISALLAKMNHHMVTHEQWVAGLLHKRLQDIDLNSSDRGINALNLKKNTNFYLLAFPRGLAGAAEWPNTVEQLFDFAETCFWRRDALATGIAKFRETSPDQWQRDNRWEAWRYTKWFSEIYQLSRKLLPHGMHLRFVMQEHISASEGIESLKWINLRKPFFAAIFCSVLLPLVAVPALNHDFYNLGEKLINNVIAGGVLLAAASSLYWVIKIAVKGLWSYEYDIANSIYKLSKLATSTRINQDPYEMRYDTDLPASGEFTALGLHRVAETLDAYKASCGKADKLGAALLEYFSLIFKDEKIDVDFPGDRNKGGQHLSPMHFLDENNVIGTCARVLLHDNALFISYSHGIRLFPSVFVISLQDKTRISEIVGKLKTISTKFQKNPLAIQFKEAHAMVINSRTVLQREISTSIDRLTEEQRKRFAKV